MREERWEAGAGRECLSLAGVVLIRTTKKARAVPREADEPQVSHQGRSGLAEGGTSASSSTTPFPLGTQTAACCLTTTPRFICRAGGTTGRSQHRAGGEDSPLGGCVPGEELTKPLDSGVLSVGPPDNVLCGHSQAPGSLSISVYYSVEQIK